jgi:hypothetical protein
LGKTKPVSKVISANLTVITSGDGGYKDEDGFSSPEERMML